MAKARFAAIALGVGVALGSCGPGDQAPAERCVVDGECPLHQYCEGGSCRTGCLSDVACDDRRCDPHGRCVSRAVPREADSGLPEEADSGLPEEADSGLPGEDAGLPGEADLSLPAGDEPPDLTIPPGCGDGVLDAGEACDDGADNSDDPAQATACSTQCRRRAPCGELAGSTRARVDPATGHCYVAWPGPLSWAAAQRACQGRGGGLATLSSTNEDALVREVAVGALHWIGLASPRAGGQAWRWATGEPRTFEGWAPGEPSSSGAGEDCVAIDPARGWDDARCGWPSSGNLPASTAHALGYVCELSCGNGLVEAGEGCDPPGPSCTPTCQLLRACSEPGGVASAQNGHCYFAAGPASNLASALNACPAGTHLATLHDPAEAEAAAQAISAETWIALRSTAPGRFEWLWGEPDFNPQLFHGFSAGEPNQSSATACVRAGTSGSWRDTSCTGSFLHLCERE